MIKEEFVNRAYGAIWWNTLNAEQQERYMKAVAAGYSPKLCETFALQEPK